MKYTDEDLDKDENFDKWYNRQFDEWHKDYRTELMKQWRILHYWFEVPDPVIEDILDVVVSAIKDQYGE